MRGHYGQRSWRVTARGATGSSVSKPPLLPGGEGGQGGVSLLYGEEPVSWYFILYRNNLKAQILSHAGLIPA